MASVMRNDGRSPGWKSAVGWSYSVACRHERVCRSGVNSSYAAGGHERDARKEFIDRTGRRVENVSAVAGDVGRASGDDASEMVLGDDFHGEMVLEDVDVGVVSHLFDEALLDFESGVVGVVEDSEFGVSTFAVEVEFAVVVAVEVNAPFEELPDLLGGFGHHFSDRHGVGQPVARDHGVLDMLFDVVEFEVGDGSHAALRESGVCLIKGGFTHERHTSGAGHFEGETHSGNAGADYEIIVFVSHGG